MDENHEIPTEEQRTKAAARIEEFGTEFDRLLDAFQQGRISRDDFKATLAARQTAQAARQDTTEARASTDALTGLLNKKAFDEKFRLTVDRLKRLQEAGHPEYAVVINIDLNGLKEVNDTEGHEAGNRMLRKFASVFKENSRMLDNLAVVARPGGDEFMGILTNTDQNGVLNWWQRLVPKLEENGLRASIGSADIDTNNPQKSLEQADKAMYAAKQLKGDGQSHYMQTKTVGTEIRPVEILPQSR